MKTYWQQLTLVDRIRTLRYIMPLVLIPIVVIYQLQIAVRLEAAYGHTVHYAAEISFYSFVGPVVTWMTLVWVERRLKEKEALEREVRLRREQLDGLTSTSPDAILSLDSKNRITSWNQGAARLFGFSAEDMLGQPVWNLLPDAEDLDRLVPDWSDTQSVEMTAIAINEMPVQVDLTQAILDNEGVRLLILRDITLRSERAAILEEERARITRDLHDGLAQTLYFIALKADMAREQLSNGLKAEADNFADISRQARGAIREVRRAIFSLKPMEWENGNFLSALSGFVEDFAKETNLKASFRSNLQEGQVPPRLQLQIFRLVQESLNNVAKHAGAGQVLVEIQAIKDNKELKVLVTDDGSGFDPSEISGGFGIQQMNKRVARVQGTVQITGRPGHGTQVEARLPMQNAGVINAENTNPVS